VRSARYTADVIGKLHAVLAGDTRITYAILFGSRGRDAANEGSDVDVAVGLADGTSLSAMEIGALVSRLEGAVGARVDLVLLDEARPGVAYRVFRDGKVVIERDRRALLARKTRAILEYLDFRPIEQSLARGALRAAQRG
jgi:predicted nucleotidyltransferase